MRPAAHAPTTRRRARGRAPAFRYGDEVAGRRVLGNAGRGRYRVQCMRCGRTTALTAQQLRDSSGCVCVSRQRLAQGRRARRVGETIGNFTVVATTDERCDYGAIYLMRCNACGDTVPRSLQHARRQSDCGCQFGKPTEYILELRNQRPRGARQYAIAWDRPTAPGKMRVPLLTAPAGAVVGPDAELERFLRDHPGGGTLEQVAREYVGEDGHAVTRERIRQIEERALQQLRARHPNAIRALLDNLTMRAGTGGQSAMAVCEQWAGTG